MTYDRHVSGAIEASKETGDAVEWFGRSWAAGPQRRDRNHLTGNGSEPALVLPAPSAVDVEAVMLIRLGDRLPLPRYARHLITSLLVARLEPMVRSMPASFAITTMPERRNAKVEHTFISLVREVARDLDIECINDTFHETCDRPDVSDLPRHERRSSVQDAWAYRGRLDGRTVLLLDDVVDTGQSLQAAASVLALAGARVEPIALLRLQGENAAMERTIRRYYGAQLHRLLELPEVHGSLRRMLECWSRE